MPEHIALLFYLNHMSGTLPGAVSSSKSPCPLTAILLSVLHVHTLTNDFPRAQIFIIDHGKKYRFQLFIADFSRGKGIVSQINPVTDMVDFPNADFR